MKVTIYTINDAESDFCKQAKDFLTAHNIQFENKDVEHDRKALSEMLAVSDNFSGVPVIVIEEDGGEKKVLKGFTQQEVEQALGLSAAAPQQAEAAPAAPISPAEVPMPAAAQAEPFDSAQGVAVAPEKVEPTTQPLDQTMSAQAPVAATAPIMPDPMATPTMPAAAVPPTDDTAVAPMTSSVDPVMPAAPVETPVAQVADMSAPVETPATPASDDNHEDQLKGIMDTLAQTAAAPVAAEPAAPTVPETPAMDTTPVMPTMDTASVAPIATPAAAAPAGDMPNIPDFPQK